MTLKELEGYNPITIQCHDNPDADALASGYAMYKYFSSKGKDVRFVYSGRFPISKSNLLLMVDRLNIPVTYVKDSDEETEGLLLTVDCQYGCSNISGLKAKTIAVIDHHQPEIMENELCVIRPDLGSCSTLCWKMMKDEGFDFEADSSLGTALYYGLYTDTQSFTEIHNPLDMDLRDNIICNKSYINLFRNSNISRDELEIAGIALIRNIYNDKNRFSLVKSGPCDPNILGLISDFLLQVDGVDVCVVYNELTDGFKISVRSCVKEVKANELAEYLCRNVGSGGGHTDKAGGFIKRSLCEKEYPGVHSESFFGDRLNSYFDETEILNTAEAALSNEGMELYSKKAINIGYVRGMDVFPVGTMINVRTMEGDVELKITEDLFIMIGVKGEVYPTTESKFAKSYTAIDKPYDSTLSPVENLYIPKITNRATGEVKQIDDLARQCISSGGTQVYAKELDHYVKIFTRWDEESYMLGKPGDYIAVRTDDDHDYYVIEKDIMSITYDKVGK